MDPTTLRELRALHKQGRLIPFIGAGFSARFGLPSWSQLIDQIARELGWDPEVFKLSGSFLQLADYYVTVKGSIGPLRSLMDRKFSHLGGLPCAVEHGGLFVDALKGLPSGLSRVVWDQVGDQLCTWIPPTGSRSARARSVVAYCDGKRVHLFQGETQGEITLGSRGAYAFQWDPIFIPQGASQTYAELGFPAKGDYSQGHKAWKQLFAHLKDNALP